MTHLTYPMLPHGAPSSPPASRAQRTTSYVIRPLRRVAGERKGPVAQQRGGEVVDQQTVRGTKGEDDPPHLPHAAAWGPLLSPRFAGGEDVQALQSCRCLTLPARGPYLQAHEGRRHSLSYHLARRGRQDRPGDRPDPAAAQVRGAGL